MGVVSGLCLGTVQLLVFSCYAGSFWLGAYLVQEELIQAGQFVTVSAYMVCRIIIVRSLHAHMHENDCVCIDASVCSVILWGQKLYTNKVLTLDGCHGYRCSLLCCWWGCLSDRLCHMYRDWLPQRQLPGHYKAWLLG